MTANERRLIDELLDENRLKAAHSGALVAMVSRSPVSAAWDKQLSEGELQLLQDIARYSRRCELYQREVRREEAIRALANPSGRRSA